MGNNIACCKPEPGKEEIVSANIQDNMNNASYRTSKSNYLLNDIKAARQGAPVLNETHYDENPHDSIIQHSIYRNTTFQNEFKSDYFKEVNHDNDPSPYITAWIDNDIHKQEMNLPKLNKAHCISHLKDSSIIKETKELIYDYCGFEGIHIDAPNSIYIGERNKEFIKEGFGKIIYSNGSSMEGIWYNDKLTYGRQIQIIENKIRKVIIREGTFINSLISKGNEKYDDVTYEGEFKNGLKNGLGQLKSNLEEYFGLFKDSLKQGRGKLIYLKTGNIYDGNFDMESIDGYGIYQWKNGDEYIGNFKNGLFEGEGRYKWANDDIYEGHYSKGIREGKGKLITNKGEKIYQGEFKNNKPHGKGVIIKSNKAKAVEHENGHRLNDLKN